MIQNGPLILQYNTDSYDDYHKLGYVVLPPISGTGKAGMLFWQHGSFEDKSNFAERLFLSGTAEYINEVWMYGNLTGVAADGIMQPIPPPARFYFGTP